MPPRRTLRVTYDLATHEKRLEAATRLRPVSPDVFGYLDALTPVMPQVVAVARWESEPDGQADRRFHERFHEMVFMLRGHGAYEINGRRVATAAKDVLLLKPTDVHRYLRGSHFECVSMHISFEGFDRLGGHWGTPAARPGKRDAFLRFLAHAYPRLQKVTLVQADELHRRVLDMAAEYRGPGAGSRLLESAQFLQILILLARNVLFSRAAQTGRTRSTRQRDTIMVRQVAQYLDEHYGERIDTEGLFRNYFLHPNYCRNIFKALSGMSVSRYLLRRRMGEARRLVQETDMPLKAVADTVGMRDYAYFMRAFKRTHGVPPGRLRATPNGRKAS